MKKLIIRIILVILTSCLTSCFDIKPAKINNTIKIYYQNGDIDTLKTRKHSNNFSEYRLYLYKNDLVINSALSTPDSIIASGVRRYEILEQKIEPL